MILIQRVFVIVLATTVPAPEPPNAIFAIPVFAPEVQNEVPSAVTAPLILLPL